MSASAVARDPLVPSRGLTRGEYDALVDSGVLDGERVELLEGALVAMSPQGEPHMRAIVALNRFLVRSLSDEWDVRPQGPLAVGDDSEPEPDLAVVPHEPIGSGHPLTAALVIEVTVSSQRADLVHKPRLYARAGVGEYWVLDLPREEVVVHRLPGQQDYGDVERRPWTESCHVLGLTVDLADLLSR